MDGLQHRRVERVALFGLGCLVAEEMHARDARLAQQVRLFAERDHLVPDSPRNARDVGGTRRGNSDERRDSALDRLAHRAAQICRDRREQVIECRARIGADETSAGMPA